MENLKACAAIVAAEIPEELYQVVVLVLALSLITVLIIAPWKAEAL